MAKLLKRTALLGAVAACGGTAFYLTADVDTQMQIASASGPLLRMLDPELSHIIGVQAAARGLLPRDTRPDPPSLHTKVFGLSFSNPLGLAAGFDKNAEAVAGLMGLGFGFVEVGSITPRPQPGNPTPRVFRIPELKATINRYGFNNLGADAVQDHLANFEKQVLKDPSVKRGPLGVNLGKNKSSKDAAQDYCIGLTRLAQHADYLVVNVSSPNTPGLRALQGRKELEALVKQVKGTRDRMLWGPSGPPPLLIKVAPDLSEPDKRDIAAVALGCGVDGLIVSNTTIQRPGKVAEFPAAAEAGGLSGPPLFEMSTAVLADIYRLTGGRLPLVGCGGVSSGEDAYRKIRAGASLVQLYTSFAYEGPALVPRLKRELAECLERDGFNSVAEAVGADHPDMRRGGAGGAAAGAGGRSWFRWW
ncbi:Dihydroorotate dehydrogenase (fumarate) [Pleodorina starrii]|uniref:Dihydroorotate dehydrogenase (quinone), mitochondrial n=1 Tax=Pleodorina starrii TaxID=330485 RepID=A0A9W6C160_9CHLO|nr:Dihydroorotate dehydrogenase (fumarate) [Pleodorina starrii]GLC61580.1 Dihydroorotate dehydrogenase (fumarate) [Pleodorina starrii]GLC76976.1 Dihydroorotate dehydrogenase (fumarate) [Pleodorina starrii]